MDPGLFVVPGELGEPEWDPVARSGALRVPETELGVIVPACEGPERPVSERTPCPLLGPLAESVDVPPRVGLPLDVFPGGRDATPRYRSRDRTDPRPTLGEGAWPEPVLTLPESPREERMDDRVVDPAGR